MIAKIIFQLSLSPGKEPEAMKTTHSSHATPQWSSEQTSRASIICLIALRSACLVTEDSLLFHLQMLFCTVLCVQGYSWPPISGGESEKESVMIQRGWAWGVYTEEKCHKMTVTLKKPYPAIERDLCNSLHFSFSPTLAWPHTCNLSGIFHILVLV